MLNRLAQTPNMMGGIDITEPFAGLINPDHAWFCDLVLNHASANERVKAAS